jgi:hypothetical protein
MYINTLNIKYKKIKGGKEENRAASMPPGFVATFFFAPCGTESDAYFEGKTYFA